MTELYLDADGVIVDQLPERFLGLRNAYGQLHPDSRFAQRVAAREYLDDPEAYAEDYELFSTVNTLIRNLPEGLALMDIVAKGKDVSTRDELLAVYEGMKEDVPQWIETRKAERQILAEDQEAWLDLHNVYSHFAREIPRLSRIFSRMHLLSNKEADVSARLLERMGLRNCFKGVFCSYEKGNFIRRHAQQKPVYVDDSLAGALETHALGITTFLASWGYNTPDQWREAEREGIYVLTEDAFMHPLREAA